jgi:zinc transport system ATP-binding protein
MDDERIVEVEDVSFSFGGAKVLSDISFSIHAGDFIGLIGPNGSGKTTLLKLMLGLYPAHAGRVRLFGRDVHEFRDWSAVAYVPQKAASIEENFPATVREVVGMGLLSKKSFPKRFNKKDSERIGSALITVDMADYGSRRIGELSGGQQQRVFIARAIVSEPRILFLDEPTTGVDHDTQNRFYGLLDRLNKDGITIVLVSHDIGRITKYVNKIASLNQRLEFYGTHSEFCAWDGEHRHKTEEEHKLCLHRG